MVSINPRTGQVVPDGTPGSIKEPFKPGTEPGNRVAAYDAEEEFPAAQQTSTIQAPAADTVNVDIGSGTGGLY
jgi:hypothetical protein